MNQKRDTPWTVAESSGLPPETKDAMLREAKPGTWYDNWHPYCGTCDTMARMHQEAYGFRCGYCGNMIAWDLPRLVESPLNRRQETARDDATENLSVHQIRPLDANLGMGPASDYMKAAFSHIASDICSEDLEFQFTHRYAPAPTDTSWHRSSDDKEPWRTDYSRMDTYPGPTGHPGAHRRQRRMKKQIRRRNRRK
jgi:hypothetical protein